jgi:hypothetical protein
MVKDLGTAGNVRRPIVTTAGPAMMLRYQSAPAPHPDMQVAAPDAAS